MICYGCRYRYEIGQSEDDTDCRLPECPYKDEEEKEEEEDDDDDDAA
jgi:hypothetical protein